MDSNHYSSCGIIERSALQRAIIRRYIEQTPALQIVWECEFQETAHACFEQQIPDILFLSLHHLPVAIDSLLRPLLVYHQGIIITSGFHPAEVGQLPFSIVDFLQQPFSFEQFTISIGRFNKSL